jgi:acyl-CoA dehydrogenase
MMTDQAVSEELRLLRDAVRRFIKREVTPHVEEWRTQGSIDRSAWRKAGDAGLLCAALPEEHGGGGGTFRHEAVITEEFARAGFSDFMIPLHNTVVAPYIAHFGTEEQKRRWLPRMATGELVGAIALTEPGAGSDLRGIRTSARREGGHYAINGQKTFISNGHSANLICVAVKTAPEKGGSGLSILVLETDACTSGFRRGPLLKKVGMQAQDTAELFFDDVRVPAGNLIAAEGEGFAVLTRQLAQERLTIAVQAVASLEAAVEETVRYVKERNVFGKPLLEFQNTRFQLAEAKSEATIARIFLDHCIDQLMAGELDPTTAAMAKWWTTEKQNQIIDLCVQLHGGYGYMLEVPIARRWVDARIQKIYGGANEIMKELVARSL